MCCSQEDPRKTLYFAHLFVGDHLLNTIWTTFFAVSWWVYNPHDGKRIANSDAQKDMMGSGGPTMTDEERKQAAQLIWNQEKGLAATVLIIGWLLKVGPMLSPSLSHKLACSYAVLFPQIYFAVLLYSYAVHLRKGTYRSLPLSNPTPDPSAAPFLSTSALADPAEEYELGDEERNYEQQARLPPTRRPNGSTRFPSASARIMHDLEAPMESVLWDDDEDAPGEGTSSSSAPLKSVHTETSISEGESEGGDIAGSVPRSRLVEKGKSRFA